jgi:hypothetical protein
VREIEKVEKRAGRVAQVVEHLLRKREAQRSNPSTTKKERKVREETHEMLSP